MKSQILLDTVFIVALINEDDDLHEQAVELSAQYEGHALVVTDAILLEVGNALARNHKREAIEIISSLLASEDVEVVHLTPQLFRRGFALYQAYQDKAWGLVDCITFTLMKDTIVTAALTFDRHFEQAGFQVLMRDNRK
jgi:predicted nucleic acid-binding protein